MRSLRREPVLLLALLAAIGLVLAFIVYPQIQVVLVPGPDGYVKFLTGGTWVGPLVNSLQVTLLSTTTAVILGFVFAYAMVYTPMPWKPFFRIIGILPLLSPPFVVAAVYVLLFGPRGIVSYGVFGQSPSVFGLMGIWGVQTIAFFPFAYQLIADVLSRSDARLEQAARNLGAGPWSVFRSITLPLSGPGLGAAILTTAIYVLEDFGNPQLIGGGFRGQGVLDAAAPGAADAHARVLRRVSRARRHHPARLRHAHRERAHAVFPDEPRDHLGAFPIPRRACRGAAELVRLQPARGDRLLDLRALRRVRRAARLMAGPEDLRLPPDHAGRDPWDLLRHRLPHGVQPAVVRSARRILRPA